jgi:hypothetical protein
LILLVPAEGFADPLITNLRHAPSGPMFLNERVDYRHGASIIARSDQPQS